MSELKIGDIVARKSYGCDVLFKVVDIHDEDSNTIVTLKGISYRIEADASEADLEVQSEKRIRDYRRQCRRIAKSKLRKDSKIRRRMHTKNPVP